MIETRVITLDQGSHLNKTAVSFDNLKETTPVATGIVLHEPDGAVVADAAAGYITYVDPTDNVNNNNGKIFVGAAFPTTVKEAKSLLFPEKERMNCVVVPMAMYWLSAIMNRVQSMFTTGVLPGTRLTSKLRKHGMNTWQTMLRRYVIR